MITNNYVNRVCELVSRISENGGRGHVWFLILKKLMFFLFLKTIFKNSFKKYEPNISIVFFFIDKINYE